VITYELATVANRMVSNLLDTILVYVINFLVAQFGDGYSNPGYYMLSSIGFVWLYHLIVAIFFRGITAGMRATGLKPMKPGGGNVEFSDLFLRWVTRPLDITLSFGALGIFLMLGSEKRQRLGDMLAGTVIVHKRHSMHFSLRDIISFHEKTHTEDVKYPGVKYVKESDMLLIKNLLYNQAGYNRQTQEMALQECAGKMTELLNLDIQPADNRGFLQQLVNDYIVLTR